MYQAECEAVTTPSPGLMKVKVNLRKTDWRRIKEIAKREDRTAAGLLRMIVARGLEDWEGKEETEG